MIKGVEAGNFIESAEFSGNMYGTSYKAINDVLDAKKNVVLDVRAFEFLFIYTALHLIITFFSYFRLICKEFKRSKNK
jgi:guanylate kinase